MSFQVSTCAASFSAQWVWLCLLFTSSCFSSGQALKTVYYFLTQKQIIIQQKIVYVHSTNLHTGKLSDFDNIWIRTPPHPY